MMRRRALSILPVHSQHRGRIFLPFIDEDPKTAEIVPKVLLLGRRYENQRPIYCGSNNVITRKCEIVNIQIFGKAKCFDTKKAERYFKERKIKYQFIEINKYGLSKGEYQSIKAAVGSMAELIDEKSKEYESQHIKYLARQDDVEERLLEYPGMFKTPIVRNGKKATIGYQPEVWSEWN